MQIFIKNISGKTITIGDISPTTTIDELKAEIHHSEGNPIEDQRLIYQGKQLSNGHLEDYGIGDNATLHLVLRMR